MPRRNCGAVAGKIDVERLARFGVDEQHDLATLVRRGIEDLERHGRERATGEEPAGRKGEGGAFC